MFSSEKDFFFALNDGYNAYLKFRASQNVTTARHIILILKVHKMGN